MNIAYILADTPVAGHSALASIRYRATIPGEWIKKQGHRVTYIGSSAIDDLNKLDGLDVLIVGKCFEPEIIEIVKYIKSINKKIIVDFCDDHFSNPRLSLIYRELSNLADTIVVSTEFMRDTVHKQTGLIATVIGDPYEGQYRPYIDRRNEQAMNLFWFGHHGNLRPLIRIMPDLNRVYQKYLINLMIMTNVNFAQDAVTAAAKNFRFPVFLHPWSIKGLADGLNNADLVLLPSEQNNQFQAKSANRLIEAIWSGCPVWAHSTPAYNEFSAFATINNDTYPGILRALTRTDYDDIIRDGQCYIAQNYSPDAIGKKWLEVITL